MSKTPRVQRNVTPGTPEGGVRPGAGGLLAMPAMGRGPHNHKVHLGYSATRLTTAYAARNFRDHQQVEVILGALRANQLPVTAQDERVGGAQHQEVVPYGCGPVLVAPSGPQLADELVRPVHGPRRAAVRLDDPGQASGAHLEETHKLSTTVHTLLRP